MMINAHSAKLVRVATRALGGSVSNEIPLTAGEGNQFSVVVEGIAGRLLSTTGQPYSLEIVASDITTGANPHTERNNFTQKRLEQFDCVDGWPNKVATFTVTLNDIPAVQGHLQGLGKVRDCLTHGVVMPRSAGLGWRRGRCCAGRRRCCAGRGGA
jgi:hypothetical protein